MLLFLYIYETSLIPISLKLVHNGPIDNKLALVLMIAWCRTGWIWWLIYASPSLSELIICTPVLFCTNGMRFRRIKWELGHMDVLLVEVSEYTFLKGMSKTQKSILACSSHKGYFVKFGKCSFHCHWYLLSFSSKLWRKGFCIPTYPISPTNIIQNHWHQQTFNWKRM